jgi:hypothetical protein
MEAWRRSNHGAVLRLAFQFHRPGPPFEIEAPWTDIAGIARRLIAREFVGNGFNMRSEC